MPQMNLALVVGAVIGLTQWVKTKLNVTGRAAEVVSFVIGLVFGGGYQIVMFPPTTPQDIFGAAVVAVLIGLVPSGLYQFGSVMASKVGTGQVNNITNTESGTQSVTVNVPAEVRQS